MSSLYCVLLLERARVETSLNQELEFGPKLDLGDGMRYRVAGSLRSIISTKTIFIGGNIFRAFFLSKIDKRKHFQARFLRSAFFCQSEIASSPG